MGAAVRGPGGEQARGLPLPALSSATVSLAVWVSLRTVTAWWATAPGRPGPADCQIPFLAVKMPTVPARLQVPASNGPAEEANTAAVRLSRPQRRPGGVAASVRWLVIVLHLV